MQTDLQFIHKVLILITYVYILIWLELHRAEAENMFQTDQSG